MHIVGANGFGRFDRGEELVTEAREGGIIEEIRLENCVRNPQRSASMFDLILYEKCRAEPNLTLLLNTALVAVEMDGTRIARAFAERQSTEDRFRIEAEIFVDCTGDGRLGVETGAPFMEGREGGGQFAESLAPEQPDANRLGSTILIQARKHDQPMPFVAPPWAREFSREDLRLRLYASPGAEEPSHEYGYWWAEWGGTLDTIKDNETIRDELLAIVMGIWNHIKNGPPGTAPGAAPGTDPFKASHWALDWFGFLPGKRESRRFIGIHVLTESDLLQSRSFADAIAYGGWPIDIHPPEGVDAPDQEPCEQHRVPFLYDIPLRCCISRDIENLMFAGRNFSATHVAFASTRVMATCFGVGQGVGTSAAFAVREQMPLHRLPLNTALMTRIQQQLLKDDAYLIGRLNEDPDDLARSARISASGFLPGCEPAQVISGQTRSVHGEWGAPPERNRPGTHRWMTGLRAGEPAWIQLEWEQPVRIRGIDLVFDTGLHRHLTLSHHDGYTVGRMLWGRPQPETVRDYSVEGWNGCKWIGIGEATANHQRLCRHSLDPPRPFSRIRIVIQTTNGSPEIRIAEIRVRSAHI